MHPAHFLFFATLCTGILFALHIARIRGYRGPYVMFITFLWFLIYLTGQLNYKTAIVFGDYSLSIRYSSAFYTLIFAGILLVYICEGVRESRNLILIAPGSQLVIALIQAFFAYDDLGFLHLAQAAESPAPAGGVFAPTYWRLMVSSAAVVVDLFFAIWFFQFLVNRLKRAPLVLLLFAALAGTMILDSVIFVAGTRLEEFWRHFPNHVIYKTGLSLGLAGPMGLYVRWFQKSGKLDLNRGSLDIFSRLQGLEKDLARAHEELREYASGLERKVDERTRELKARQAQIDLELEMAAGVQRATLPPSKNLPVDHATAFLPCSSVSGDLYHYGQIRPGEVFVFLGDISGHGVASGLIGAMCMMSISRINLREKGPADVLKIISQDIGQLSGSQYLVGVYLLIDLEKRILRYSNGGHIGPILIGPSGRQLQLEATGSLIGAGVESGFPEKRIAYKSGTRLVAFTDCATEQKNAAREEFGQERLLELLGRHRDKDPAALKEILLDAWRTFAAGPFDDDLTLLILDLP